MNRSVKQERTPDAQQVSEFTGEGAYHGSTKTQDAPIRPAPVSPEVDEVLPATLNEYWRKKQSQFSEFPARFTNHYEVGAQLRIPTQQEIQADAVTFCWATLEQAQRDAGPLTQSVLAAMVPLLSGRKKFVYIDSKIQFFKEGDLPVDSRAWHVDGTIVVRDQRSRDLGFDLLHDMRSRMTSGTEPPTYMAYQSSLHCATQFATEGLTISLPDCITNFDALDLLVEAARPKSTAQPAGSIVRFDGHSLHRAVRATADGWRLWIRCTETDREIHTNPAMIHCYGTVFRSSSDM